jgi:predicted AAA+ superfamily ATPase
MEYSGLWMAGISSSFSGSVSESVYGRFRAFVFLTLDFSEFVSKSNFFLAFLSFMLEFFSFGGFGITLLLLELL